MNRRILNESLMSDAEANDIVNIWNELKKKVNDDINNHRIKTDFKNRILLYNDTFHVNANTIGEINVEYVFYIVENEHMLWAIKNNMVNISLSCEADYETKTIKIKGLYYKTSQKIDEVETCTNLSHEFHHLYQYQQGFTKNEYLDSLYDRCVNGYNSKNQIIRITAQLLYHTFKHEISAFSVQLYNSVKNDLKKYKEKGVSVDDLKQTSNEYRNYLLLKRLFDRLFDDYDDVFEIIEEYFGITVNVIDKRIENADNIYNRYFIKVLSNVISDIRADGHTYMNETVKFTMECYNNHYEDYIED